MARVTVQSFKLQVCYATKRGTHIIKWLTWDEAVKEIQRLAKRGTEATAYYTDINGNRKTQAGAVWKMNGRWAWYFDAKPQHAYAAI